MSSGCRGGGRDGGRVQARRGQDREGIFLQAALSGWINTSRKVFGGTDRLAEDYGKVKTRQVDVQEEVFRLFRFSL